MEIKKIKSIADQLNHYNIYELLEENNLNWQTTTSLNNRKLDALLFENTILVKEELEENYIQFILFHELGHRLLHQEANRSFGFYLSKYKNRIENEANIFAFYCLFNDENLEDVDVIDLAIRRGIPRHIAINIIEKINIS